MRGRAFAGVETQACPNAARSNSREASAPQAPLAPPQGFADYFPPPATLKSDRSSRLGPDQQAKEYLPPPPLYIFKTLQVIL